MEEIKISFTDDEVGTIAFSLGVTLGTMKRDGVVIHQSQMDRVSSIMNKINAARDVADKTEKIEKIEAAAIKHAGCVYSMPRPARHHDVIKLMAEQGYSDTSMRDQGFVTTLGRFVDRKEACLIARAAGQVDEAKKTGPQDTLFSEDLW